MTDLPGHKRTTTIKSFLNELSTGTDRGRGHRFLWSLQLSELRSCALLQLNTSVQPTENVRIILRVR